MPLLQWIRPSNTQNPGPFAKKYQRSRQCIYHRARWNFRKILMEKICFLYFVYCLQILPSLRNTEVCSLLCTPSNWVCCLTHDKILTVPKHNFVCCSALLLMLKCSSCIGFYPHSLCKYPFFTAESLFSSSFSFSS